MRDKAQEWLCKEMRKARIALGHAENRPGVTDEELSNLRDKVAAVDWLLEMIGCSSGSRWISVKDRLPMNMRNVLMLIDGIGAKIGYYQPIDGLWSYDGWRPITHWMPLPHPPKEE